MARHAFMQIAEMDNKNAHDIENIHDIQIKFERTL